MNALDWAYLSIPAGPLLFFTLDKSKIGMSGWAFKLRFKSIILATF